MPLPCSDQNPRLKCPETRWARDFCLAHGGSCEYKIEAHFDCLTQYYPTEKVEELRKAFKPNTLDYPTSDTYIRYRHYYVGGTVDVEEWLGRHDVKKKKHHRFFFSFLPVCS
ncbi:hypothetical protein AGDE_06086 [Angomonas deanei]|uniref:Cytochrome C oxidase copper chaperone (COX17), putative n=1 Tax=Angomonas deanei TaxID=59799 RepID=A0A7G2CMN8_9TRYP|nr:hypothetical protein AGDE_06086 [Angomonas deanei]CAD2220685.1 Cytochrome C oxidase copper chaperone (COX17), putative [Angomonas deanei]|eukprot:EPY37847.1 hypothetical protein AGDE_06086 [Angomonas deanei]